MLTQYSLYNLNMLKISDIKKLYEKYKVNASKRFGQNFLIDQNILKNIIKVADIKNKDVIEIGPGLGSLTYYLLEEAKSVTSYEIDSDMVRVLKGEVDNEKFILIEEDFLRVQLEYQGKRTFVSNIPYNITSDILFKLFENSQKIDRAIIMMQKEVAERLTAKVGSKEYGKLAISAKHFAKIKYEFDVPRDAFLPSPNVDSAVVSFEFNKVDYDESKDFLKFVKQCFAMRRKTLFNNLKNFLGAEKARELILKIEKKESVRPQELSYKDFVNVFNNVK